VRFETPTEDTMEVVEFEPERLMRVKTQDGTLTINGWAAFTESGDNATRLTLGGEFPGMDESMTDMIRPLMKRSVANIKQLVESETPKS
jgi:hypothetical protein